MKLQNTKDAFEQAIGAGYLAEDIKGRKVKVSTNAHGDFFDIQAGNFEMTVPESEIMLDRAFWEALAKSFKWDQPIWDCHKKYPNAKCENREYCEYGGWKSWENVARQWFEARLLFGDEEGFWQSLP